MVGFSDKSLLAILNLVGEPVEILVPPNRTIMAFFDTPVASPEMGGMIFSTNKPQLTARTADVATLESGDYLTVRGKTWQVTDTQDDGHGVTVIKLDVWVEI